ncbi:efflux RND transporter permease subunit [Noviherbaspirillum sedimenti]
MKSILMASARWTQVTEEGYEGAPIMPSRFDNPEAAFKQLRINVDRAKAVGSLVGTDQRSAMIVVPLLGRDPATGQAIDYHALSKNIEAQVRSLEGDGAKIHIIGFAQLVGDLISGLGRVAIFFVMSVLLATAIIFFYTRCVRSTLMLVFSSLVGVTWLLGIMRLTGFALDPYSVLVPFLIFAIGLSHGAQKMNGIMQDVGRGTHKYVAARYTFRRLFLTGLTALLANLVGFSVFIMIDIPIIKEMAIVTSIGVTVLIFTKLVFIPVALSYIGVSPSAAARSIVAQERLEQSGDTWVSRSIERLTRRPLALAVVGVSLLIGVIAATISLTMLKTGDLDPGAPELRVDSRYNRDVDFISRYFGQTSEQFAVIVKTKPGECYTYPNLVEVERLAWALQGVEGVLAVQSHSGSVRKVLKGAVEGSPKWDSIIRNRASLGSASARAQQEQPDLVNLDCSITPLVVYLTDHKAETLDSVLKTVEAFAAEHNSADISFMPAAGSAGIESITNIVVREAQYPMLLALYVAVMLLCYWTFRSWRATVVALIPLVITSFLCEALMVALGIGVKVSTLPVIALGVGIGVDYALYLLSVQIALQRKGVPLAAAYQQSIAFTGRMVLLVALTMAVSVFTWAWSPIKFQADMGILLAFMFIWNMVGALILIPALSHFFLSDKLHGVVVSGQTDSLKKKSLTKIAA